MRGVLCAIALSLGVFVLLAGIALGSAFDAANPTPLTTVFAVVGAGLSLTAALFHAARLGAARSYAQKSVAAETLRAHLEALER